VADYADDLSFQRKYNVLVAILSNIWPVNGYYYFMKLFLLRHISYSLKQNAQSYSDCLTPT
jgi:hypothetical protein